MDIASLQNQAQVFKALAHPLRLKLLLQLGEGERCVAELAQDSGVDLSTLSRHLTLLKQTALVADRREGKWIYYRLLAPCVLEFVSCLAARSGPGCACEEVKHELA